MALDVGNGSEPAGAAGDGEAPFGMTDLEEVLRGPDGAAAREGIVTSLSARIAEIEAAIAGGLPAQEFEAAEAIRQSLVTARNIMLLSR